MIELSDSNLKIHCDGEKMESNASSTAFFHFPLSSLAKLAWKREAPYQVCFLYPGFAWAAGTCNKTGI